MSAWSHRNGPVQALRGHRLHRASAPATPRELLACQRGPRHRALREDRASQHWARHMRQVGGVQVGQTGALADWGSRGKEEQLRPGGGLQK